MSDCGEYLLALYFLGLNVRAPDIVKKSTVALNAVDYQGSILDNYNSLNVDAERSRSVVILFKLPVSTPLNGRTGNFERILVDCSTPKSSATSTKESYGYYQC